MALGADAVQMGTRFIGTYECDASDVLKQVLLGGKGRRHCNRKFSSWLSWTCSKNKFNQNIRTW